MRYLAILGTLGVLITGGNACSGQSPTDRAAIEKAGEDYVAAFNRREAKKLAALWSPEGVYVSRSSGEQITGRAALEEEFAAIFSQEVVPQLKVATESIDFVSPNVAVERGTATVVDPEGTASDTRYRVVYVRRDGQWLIDRVTEDEVSTQVSHYQQLKDLEWLIGSWVDEGDGIAVETECSWTENRNYISRIYKVSLAEGVESSGLQIIGWDAKAKQIRSWLFDSSGGFVSGSWHKRGDRWVVQSVATLADGGSGSFTSIFRPLEDGRYGWQKVNRVVDGQLLPNTDEVIVKRQ
ncbi:MAG: SgcJ/EcaC family oxidoreductase [Planctomycetales bacterium]|nr:SgcJ/EcaC family oxidoreductase [Planctomycetales bacterium]